MAVPPHLRVGQTAQASATATRSNGTAELVGTGWRSSDPGVATVSDAGLLTGVGNGRTTISVSAGGQPAQQEVRVVPDYEGSWTGALLVDSCTPFPSRSYAHHCNGYQAGAVFPLSMTLSQSGEAVTGQFTSNGLVFTSFVVPVDAAGAVALFGTNIRNPYQTDAIFHVSSPTRGQITGTTRWERRGSSGLIGTATVEGTIVTLTRP